jgi:hypothetical protein
MGLISKKVPYRIEYTPLIFVGSFKYKLSNIQDIYNDTSKLDRYDN